MSAPEITPAEAAAFLYKEARLMDEGRYKEWLALWVVEDALYWAPCNGDDIDPRKQVSIIYDDRGRLEQRVERLASGTVLAQDPAPRMRRVISNIELGAEGDLAVVESNFILAIARRGTNQLWAGRSVHKLRREAGEWRIATKKVLLIDNDQEIPLLQFLI